MKPKFDPSKPFEAASGKPKFDPAQPFEAPRDYEAEATLAADKKFEETKPGAVEAAVLGVTQGGLRNFADDIAGALGGKAAKVALQDRVNRSKVDQSLAYTGGEIGAKIATLPATLNPWAAAGIAAADTAASGIGDDKSAKDVAIDTVVSGGLAGGLAKLLPMLSDVAKSKIAPLLQRQADQSTVKALGGTQKQVQDLGSKLPEIAELARSEKIVTPLASSSKIAERAGSFVDDAVAQTKPIYEAADDISVSTGSLIKEFDKQIAKLEGNPGMAPLRKALESRKQELIEESMAGYNPGQLRSYRGAVDKLTNFQSEAPAQEAKQITRSLLREQEMGLLEQVDPALRQANEGLFRKIHLGNLLEDMADKGAARSTNNNLFGINSQILGSGAGAAIGGVSTGEWEGVAAGAGGVMAAREIAKRYGPQVAGVYLDKIAKAMTNPKFAKLIEEAASRGPEASVALMSVLDKLGATPGDLVGGE
jgi:hypothetical protein